MYNTSYDFEATQKTMKNLEINIHKEVRELNYLKGLHQNLN